MENKQITTAKVPVKISTKNWVLIWIMGMSGQLCWAVENQSFSNYAHAVTGNPSVVTWMVALSAAATTIATFISGTLSDRLGKRKPIISIGFIIWGVCTAIFGLGDFIPENPIWLFSMYVVLMDAVMSFCGSIGYSGAANAWMTDVSDVRNRGQLATVISAMVVIANIIMGAIAGIIIDTFGFMTLFVGMGILVALVGLATIFVLKDAPTLKPSVTHKSFWRQVLSAFSFKEMFKDKQLFWVLTTLCVYTIGFNMYLSYATIYMVNYLGEASGITLNYFSSGAVQGVGMLLAVVVSLFFMKTINRGRPDIVTFIAVVCSFVFLILLSQARSIIGLVITIFGAATGYILSLQATTAWYKNLCPENKRGMIEGVKQIFYVLIPMIIGPVIAEQVINRWGVTVTVDGVEKLVPTGLLFIIAGVWSILTLIPLAVARREMKKSACAAAVVTAEETE